MKSTSAICFTFIILLFTGCERAQPAKSRQINVTTSHIEQKDVPIYIDAIGQVISPVVVPVRSQVQGKILASHVEQGAIVKQGDILYTIDPRPYQATLDQAKQQLAHDIALLDIANKTVERYKTVVEEDFISVLTYEQYQVNAKAALAQVESDKAAVIAAQLNVDFCQVVAPVSGKLGYSTIYEGNVVQAYDTTAINTILPFDPIDISFSLSQQQFELIRKEQGDSGIWPFVATLPENSKVTFEGKTYFIDNQINQNTGTIFLKGRFPNPQRKVWPGEFINVKVLNKMAPNALVVPPGAVLIGKDGPYVYRVEAQNKTASYPVKVLTRTNEYIAIESTQLKKGDLVVIDGQINITNGSLVNPLLQPPSSKTGVESVPPGSIQ
jgi:RND family efflux transporter MFP subunit